MTKSSWSAMLELFQDNLPCVLLQHQCLQAVSTQKEERRETRGRVVWATFETGDANGVYLSWPLLHLANLLHFTANSFVQTFQWSTIPGWGRGLYFPCSSSSASPMGTPSGRSW